MLLSEEEFLPQLMAGDGHAMAVVYRQYRRSLHAAVLKIVGDPQTAEDVLQEGLLKVWLSIASYDAARGRFYTWAVRICCNVALDHIRSGWFRLRARTAPLEHSAAIHYAAPHDFRPEHIGMLDVLQTLRPEYRQLLDLHYVRGFTLAEVSVTLGIPLGTIKTRAAAAKRHLAQLPR